MILSGQWGCRDEGIYSEWVGESKDMIWQAWLVVAEIYIASSAMRSQKSNDEERRSAEQRSLRRAAAARRLSSIAYDIALLN